jgi:hypothetical protein
MTDLCIYFVSSQKTHITGILKIHMLPTRTHYMMKQLLHGML